MRAAHPAPPVPTARCPAGSFAVTADQPGPAGHWVSGRFPARPRLVRAAGRSPAGGTAAPSAPRSLQQSPVSSSTCPAASPPQASFGQNVHGSKISLKTPALLHHLDCADEDTDSGQLGGSGRGGLDSATQPDSTS